MELYSNPAHIRWMRACAGHVDNAVCKPLAQALRATNALLSRGIGLPKRPDLAGRTSRDGHGLGLMAWWRDDGL